MFNLLQCCYTQASLWSAASTSWPAHPTRKKPTNVILASLIKSLDTPRQIAGKKKVRSRGRAAALQPRRPHAKQSRSADGTSGDGFAGQIFADPLPQIKRGHAATACSQTAAAVPANGSLHMGLARPTLSAQPPRRPGRRSTLR